MLNFRYNSQNSKSLESAVLFSIALLVLNIIFPSPRHFPLLIFSEALTVGFIYFSFKYISGLVKLKLDSPMSVILNVGILTAIIFFAGAVSTALFDTATDLNFGPSFLSQTFTTCVSIIFLSALIYIFSVIHGLFFLRQKKNPKAYFNTMLIFFLLTFVGRVISTFDKDLDYIENAFYVVSILMIFINSLRVSWIAFLTKKQKLFLLVTSIILTTLFAMNFVTSLSDHVLLIKLSEFSPGIIVLFSLLMLYGTIYFSVIFFTALFHLPTAEAIDRRSDELSSLMNLNRLLTQVHDFKDLGETLTDLTCKICKSDSAWLSVLSDGEFEVRTTTNISSFDATNIMKALLQERDYKITDVLTYDDKNLRIEVGQDTRIFNFKSIAVAPLQVQDEIIGFLFAANKNYYSFDEDDRKSIRTFADYAAIALENAKLFQKSIEKERLEKELDVAREVQYKLLPAEIPQFKNIKMSSLFIPAFEVGGDYYDFFELANGKLGFVIADVAGKGISAAFIMAEAKGVFESLSDLIESPKQLLFKANQAFGKSFDSKTFVTAVYGVIDPDSGKLTLARAGHPPVLLKRGDKVTEIYPKGLGLGLDYGNKFYDSIEEVEIELNYDDILVLYTDGIPEAQNIDMAEFGYQKFKEIIRMHDGGDIQDLSNEIIKSVTVFSKDKPQHDDITLVIFKWFNKNNNSE